MTGIKKEMSNWLLAIPGRQKKTKKKKQKKTKKLVISKAKLKGEPFTTLLPNILSQYKRKKCILQRLLGNFKIQDLSKGRRLTSVLNTVYFYYLPLQN